MPKERQLRMKRNTLYIFFMIFLIWRTGFAQPGAYGGSLEFKVYKDGKQVDLSGKNWKIIPNNGVFKEPSNPYKHPDFYQIVSLPTPMGGMVKPEFYLDIVFKMDTMRVYTPNFSNSDVKLDSIPFKKGTYKIPNHIYGLKQMVDENKSLNYKPTLNENWEVFSTNVLETYKCYIEKIEDIEFLSRRSPYGASKEWDKMSTTKRQLFSFINNIIMTTEDSKNYVIYEIKNISETTFWCEDIGGYISINSIFQKNNTIYALIEKFYGSTQPSGTTYGIYKLHFVEESISDTLVIYLKRKQIEEDFEAVIKLVERHPNPSVWKIKLSEIKTQYDIAVKSFNETSKK